MCQCTCSGTYGSSGSIFVGDRLHEAPLLPFSFTVSVILAHNHIYYGDCTHSEYQLHMVLVTVCNFSDLFWHRIRDRTRDGSVHSPGRRRHIGRGNDRCDYLWWGLCFRGRCAAHVSRWPLGRGRTYKDFPSCKCAEGTLKLCSRELLFICHCADHEFCINYLLVLN